SWPDRQHCRVRARQWTRPAPPSQYGRKLFLPLWPFRDCLGRSGGAHTRAGAAGHDRRATRREPQLPQHLNQLGRLLVMIVPETDEQVDPVCFAPSLAKEIEDEYGKAALAGLQKIGFKFEDEPSV